VRLYCCILVGALLSAGCLATAQVVIGPAIDDVGWGAMVRVRGAVGMAQLRVVGSAEVVAGQGAPTALFGTGIGLATHIEIGHLSGFKVPIMVRGLVGVSSAAGRVGAFGGSLGLLKELHTRDGPNARQERWLLGGELTADYWWGDTSHSFLFSPGLLFEYSIFPGGKE
jgi:hypothetical protein